MEKIELDKKNPEYSKDELGEIYGDYETTAIPINKLVILPQVRERINPVQSELTKSIKSGGLMNPVDIAIFSKQQLSEHLDFINSIWKTDAKISDYDQQDDDIYPVLIAGHSRIAALKYIQSEESHAISTVAKIHNISSSAEFLSLQLAENTYGGVSQERRAIAIVEMYKYGYSDNATPNDAKKWSSYADFVRKNPGSLNENMLSDGMAFTELPTEVRDFVFSKKLPYGAGVELGKNAKTIREYVEYKLGSECPEDTKTQAYNLEISRIITILFKKAGTKPSLKQSITYIKNVVNNMRETMTPTELAGQQQFFIDEFLDISRQDKYISSLKKEQKQLLNELKRKPTENIISLLRLDSALTDTDHSKEISEMEEDYKRYIGYEALRLI